MKTKINQIDGLDLVLQYQEATVVASDIQVEQVGTLPIKFKLLADVSGTVTVNGLPLKDTDGVAVTSLENGLYEVVYDTGFFTLKSSGGSLESIYGKRVLSEITLKNSKAQDVKVKQGEFIYLNEDAQLVLDNVTNNSYDHSITETIFANDSRLGEAQIYKLLNGWFISARRKVSDNTLRIIVSKDNMTTWVDLCYIAGVTGNAFALDVKFNRVVVVCAKGADIVTANFDAKTVLNVEISTTTIETVTGVYSIVMSKGTDGIIWVGWLCTITAISTIPFLRISKTHDGINFVPPTSLIKDQMSYINLMIDSDNKPIIIFLAYDVTAGYGIGKFLFDGANWVASYIINRTTAGTHPGYPIAKKINNGSIELIYAKYTGSDYVLYERISSDNGTSFTAETLVKSGQAFGVTLSLSEDNTNTLYLYCYSTIGGFRYLKKIAGVWQNAVTLTSIGNIVSINSIINLNTFTVPILMFQTSADEIKLIGNFSISNSPQIIPALSNALSESELQTIGDGTLKSYGNTQKFYTGFKSKQSVGFTSLS